MNPQNAGYPSLSLVPIEYSRRQLLYLRYFSLRTSTLDWRLKATERAPYLKFLFYNIYRPKNAFTSCSVNSRVDCKGEKV